MPSAGRPLTWSVLLELRRRGVELASVTHAAGLSSTGDSELDDILPLPERYDIPARTVEAIGRAERVIAVGTTVVRALEGSAAANGGVLEAGMGETDLVISADFQPRIVSGLLTGVHDPSESHFRLLSAFADRDTLTRAWHHATDVGYRCHEFGDSSLILPWTSSSATDSKAALTAASTAPSRTPAPA
jgi:S-adenosylmethionine:tRNA ribosyltransferase-isomerase